ncbi:hypothetical protein Btru_041343 [Bulinus truncatus]|nr:hypothetical protein Btru_041343 [Bulinus truncatus]
MPGKPTAETENNCIEFIESDKMTVAATTEVELETEASESDMKSSGCCSTNESNENHVNVDPHLFLTDVASADESNCCSTDDKAELELADGDVNNINDANVLTADESDLTEENNYKYTTAGVNAMLKENFSSDEGDPFKNGYVVYLLSIEKKSSNVIKHLMDVASRKNFQFNPSSFSSKMRAVHKSFIKYKINIKRCWPNLMAFLEEPCQIPAPKAKKTLKRVLLKWKPLQYKNHK